MAPALALWDQVGCTPWGSLEGSPSLECRANLRIRELALRLPEREMEGKTGVEVPVTQRVV